MSALHGLSDNDRRFVVELPVRMHEKSRCAVLKGFPCELEDPPDVLRQIWRVQKRCKARGELFFVRSKQLERGHGI